jgi:hypothetical protein
MDGRARRRSGLSRDCRARLLNVSPLIYAPAMSEEQRDRDTYMKTAEVADFVRWLYEHGHLKVDSAKEAQALGERYFEESEKGGRIPENWRDKAHVNLFDWAGA